MIKILLVEILITGIILTPIVWLNIKVKKIDKLLKEQNKDLKEFISLGRSILKLSGEYVDILHTRLKNKINSVIVSIGEMTSYSLMRRFFSKNFQNYVIGFNIARLFW